MTSEPAKTHFELFGLPQAYRLDRSALDTRYRQLARETHPDRFVNRSDEERRLSLQRAAHVNEAYQVLKDPLRRARYLLELRGVQFDDERSTTQDTEFLMEQMELREALGEVRGAPDPLAALAEIAGRIRDRLDTLAERLAVQLDQDSPQDREAAVDMVHKMTFYRRLLEEAESLEADLEDELT